MKSLLKKISRYGRPSSGSATPIAPSALISQSVPSLPLPTTRPSVPEPPAQSSQSIPTSASPDLSTDQQPSPALSAPSSSAAQVPANRSDTANTTAIAYSQPLISILSGAQNVDVSHGVFNTAGGDIVNNYQLINAAPVDQEPHISYQPMPCHNELFTGRQDCLEKLQRYFTPRNESCPRRYFLVHGMGGGGKTQLCLKFVKDHSDRFWRTFWVDATTAETIKLSLRDIAADRDAQASGVERSAKSVLHWLSGIEHDWLIVFDNASGDQDGVAEYIPQGNRGNILFTNRNLGLASRYALPREARVEIEDMNEEDAVSLLLKSSLVDECSVQQKQAAHAIVKELCCLPLAVDQAGSAIASGLCNIDDYLQRYSRRRQTLLAYPTFKGASNYGRAVYGTWDLSFMAINVMGTEAAKSAIFILQTFSFFHHENIAEEIVKRAAEALKMLTIVGSGDASQDVSWPPQLLQVDPDGSWDPFVFREGVQILLCFSLIKKAATNGIYSLHPLVHCWLRDSMSVQEQQTSSSVALTLLSSSITFHFNAKDYAFRQTLIPHIKASNQCAAALDIQICYNEKQFTNFGLAFQEAGYWKEAEELRLQVMQMRKRVLGEEHPDTLASMASLAVTYSNQGRWKEAEELQVQVMQMRKRVLGEEHPDTLVSMAHLASTYRNQGRWKEAEELEVQVMQMTQRVLGEEHHHTLISMGNLVSTYKNQGRWKEAEKLGVQVMQMTKRVLGEEHPHTLTSMSHLAATYHNQGRWKEAEELEIQVMQMRNRMLGEEHPDTLLSMGDLAATYRNQGRWKEAEQLEVQVMQMRKRVLGEEHPHTLTSMGQLAITYWNQGRLKEAEELEAQVMQMKKRVLGEEHPGTLTSMVNLAHTLKSQGQNDQAITLMQNAVNLRKKILGLDHPKTVQSIATLHKWDS